MAARGRSVGGSPALSSGMSGRRRLPIPHEHDRRAPDAKTEASALPVYFCGRNSVTFQLLGLIHPRLRTLVLMQEFLQQRGKALEVRVGTAIPSEMIAGLEDDREATEYLRLRTYLLSYRGKKEISIPTKVRSVIPRKAQEAIISAVPQSLLARDIEALPPAQLLSESNEFVVYAARANEMPHLLEEVGRLREVTFRDAGEGTGKSADLDQFDDYYWHLLLWNKEKWETGGPTVPVIRTRSFAAMESRASTQIPYSAMTSACS